MRRCTGQALLLVLMAVILGLMLRQADAYPVVAEQQQAICKDNARHDTRSASDDAKADPDTDDTLNIAGLRMKSIREGVTTMAVQAAVKTRYAAINEYLRARAQPLDRIYDFGALLLYGGRVIPPVVTEANGGMRLESDTEAVAEMTTYRIEARARIVSRPPSWRDYLLRRYPDATPVNDVLCPENAEEQRAWDRALQEGAKWGREQADRLFAINMARLTRDMVGILNFRLLMAQRIVELPMYAEGEPRIQVDGETLSIGRTVFRITKGAKYMKPNEWQPLIAPGGRR